MKRPFIFISVFFSLGILLASYFKIEAGFFLVLFTFFIIVYILSRKLDLKLPLAMGLLMTLLGVFLTSLKLGKPEEIGERLYRATVENIEREKEDSRTYLVDLSHEKILLTSKNKDYEIGDIIEFKGELKRPRPRTNPKLFDYRLYLESRGINYIAYAKSDALVAKSDKKLLALRKNFIGRVDESLEALKPRNKNFLKSILLGKSDYLLEDDREAFRALGLSHILAASGLHVGIILGFFFFLMRILNVHRKISNILGIVIIGLYIYIIGFTASVVRAGIMMIIYLLSLTFNCYSDSINNLFFVSSLLMAINPYIIFNLAFQLSFFATLSILILVKNLRVYKDFKLNSLGSVLGVALGLFPLQAYYFNYFNPLSILANLIIIPMVGLALPLGLILFIINKRLVFIGGGLTSFLNIILDLIFKISEFLVDLDFFKIKLRSPSFWEIVFYYLAVLLILGILKLDFLDKAMSKALVFFLLILLVFNLYSLKLEEKLIIDFIDVGQGDAILFSLGKDKYLLDTGGDPRGRYKMSENTLIPYLDKHGIKNLRAIFISHFDYDHASGLMDLVDYYDVEQVYYSYLDPDNPICREVERRKLGSYLKAGDRLKLGEGLELDVVWPRDREDFSYLSDNDMSLVFNLSYAGRKIIFTGDIEGEAEGILSLENLDKVDFIKVAHHGSKTSSSKDFIEALGPSEAFISVGDSSIFNHPSPEVMKNYRDISCKTYTTRQSGLIKLIIDADNYEIKEFLTEKYSIINSIVENKDWVLFILMSLIFSYAIAVVYRDSKELEKFELYEF